MRARNLKPGFFINEFLLECEPLARLLFAGLWCMADRDGRLEDRPKKIKTAILPGDECDTEALLQQLADKNLIIRYVIDGVRFIAIPKFTAHQRPHVHEAQSVIPAPTMVGASTDQGRCEHALNPSSLNPSSLNPESLCHGNHGEEQTQPKPVSEEVKAENVTATTIGYHPDKLPTVKRILAVFGSSVGKANGVHSGTNAVLGLLLDGHSEDVLIRSCENAGKFFKCRDPTMRPGAARFFGEGAWLDFRDGVPEIPQTGKPKSAAAKLREKAGMQ